MIYRVCSYCGAALDPCERCDCQNEKTAPVLEHRDGQAKQKVSETDCFASNFTEK